MQTETSESSMVKYIEIVQVKVVEYSPSVLAALLTLLVGWWIAKWITRLLRKILGKRGVDATLIGFLASIGYIAMMTMVVISALGRLGVPTTSFVAILASAGLAVGFALKDSLANFASGVMLIFFRPFKAGDFVEAGGIMGSVVEIQMFATTLKTPDNKKIIVPNAAISGGNIVNFSAMDTRRIDLVFGIGYDDDIKKAKDLLKRIVGADDRVLADPAPVVAVNALGESSVDFIVRPWVNTADYWAVYWDLTEKVKLEFDANGISIPFPQQDVHMHQVA